MCKVSNKLKLCSCAAKSVNDLKHHWILHRLAPENSIYVLGELILNEVNEANERFNKSTLLKRINEPDAFDVELNPQPKDRLQLTFYFNNPTQSQTYGFKYHEGKWVNYKFNLFNWQNSCRIVTFGKTKNAIVRTNKNTGEVPLLE